MRWSSRISEAWRTVVSGTALTIPLAALVGGLVAVVIGLGSADVLALTQRAERFQESGAAVLILRAPGAVDAAACEALSTTPGVQSGALRAAAANLVAAALPNSSVPTYEVTSGFPELLGVGTAGVGVLLSQPAADALGDTLMTSAGPVAVAGVYDFPDDGRRSDLAFAIVTPTTSTAGFDECWAQQWPPSADLESLLRTTAAPSGSSSKVEILQLNGTLGQSFDGPALFRERPTRWLPILAGVGAFLLGFAATRLRRVELASARHAGVTLADQLAITLCEGVAWVALVATIAVPVTCSFVVRSAPGDAAASVAIAATATALAVAGGTTGALVAVLQSGERHLFRLFKARR